MSAKYRKKPVVIEAIQYTYNSYDEVKEFVDEDYWGGLYSGTSAPQLIIKTDAGNHYAQEGDWIIKGVNGEFYPCKPDVFEQTYEKVKENG